MLQQERYYFGRPHMGCVDMESIGSRSQGGDLSGAIGFVSRADLLFQRGIVHRNSFLTVFFESSMGSGAQIGRHEHLEASIWKNHGRHVSSFGHDAAFFAEPSLLSGEVVPHLGYPGKPGGPLRHLWLPQLVPKCFLSAPDDKRSIVYGEYEG